MKEESIRPAETGFSLLEMMISILVLLVISGAAFQAMTYYQKSALSTQLQADMHSSMRAALEVLTQEIGQAGLLSFAPRTLTAPVVANANTQSVTLSSTTDIFVGEKLLIDSANSQEVVSTTAVNGNTVTGIFSKNHAANAPVTAAGIFSDGILPSSNATTLQLFGDLNGDGSLVFAQYTCDTAAGTFTRSVTPVSANASNPPQVLIGNVVPNPDGTACFRYPAPVIANGYHFLTSVGITLTVQTAQKDPQTRAYITMTKSLLNLAPRNVMAGLDDATNSIITRLQPTPPNLPLS